MFLNDFKMFIPQISQGSCLVHFMFISMFTGYVTPLTSKVVQTHVKDPSFREIQARNRHLSGFVVSHLWRLVLEDVYMYEE